MSRYFCHEYPEVLSVLTRVVDARPGAALLGETPFHPGGGGQLADRGVLRWSEGEVRVVGMDASGGQLWHLLAAPVEIWGAVQAAVDPAFRDLMTQLHTGTHILNALVFQDFRGALVTGAQMNDDGTARIREPAPPTVLPSKGPTYWVRIPARIGAAARKTTTYPPVKPSNKDEPQGFGRMSERSPRQTPGPARVRTSSHVTGWIG